LGGHIGPYSLAGRLFDMTEIMTAILLEPDAIHELLGKCAEFLADYAKGFKEAGADGVIIAEPAAGLLSVDLCEEFSSQYVKRIVDAVQDDSFTVILHNCGNTAALVDSMAGTGAMGLHFGNVVKMSEILPHVPPDRVAMGNIDPVGVLKSGNPAGVEAAVKCLLDGMAKYPNFVISSGCDIPPSTPLENIDAFFRAVEHHK
jgi:uroporphyrinogen decarboxylase